MAVADSSVETNELVEAELWSIFVDSEPPRRSTNSRHADISSDHQVPDKEPSVDERLLGVTRWLVHDFEIGRVKPNKDPQTFKISS